MNNIQYRELRQAAEKVKRKIYSRQSISSEELETLRQFALVNPSAASVGSYALGKKLVQE